MAARYWRVVGMEAYGGGNVELSALHLYAGSADPDFSKVALLLNCNGAAGSRAFADTSAVQKTCTAQGSAQVSAAAKFGSGALSLSGSSDYLSVAHHADLDLTATDFTIEGWLYLPSGSSGGQIFNKDGVSGETYPQYELQVSGGVLRLFLGNGRGTSPSGAGMGASVTMPVAQWTHFAAEVYGSTARLYQDGVVVGSMDKPLMYDGSKPLLFGAQAPGMNFFNGGLDDLRLTRMARYKGQAFTPPGSAYPGAQDANDRVDGTALISSALAPTVGVIEALQDLDIATFAGLPAPQAGNGVQWDFVSEKKDVDVLRVGSADSFDKFLSACDLQYSDDAVTWVTAHSFRGFVWPGARTLAAVDHRANMLVRGVGRMVHELKGDSPADLRVAQAATLDIDVEDGGVGQLFGTVAKLVDATAIKAPLRRRVRLHEQRSGRLIREGWSDVTTGEYKFTGLKIGPEYCVMAFDHERQNFAVAADGQLAGEAQP